MYQACAVHPAICSWGTDKINQIWSSVVNIWEREMFVFVSLQKLGQTVKPDFNKAWRNNGKKGFYPVGACDKSVENPHIY